MTVIGDNDFSSSSNNCIVIMINIIGQMYLTYLFMLHHLFDNFLNNPPSLEKRQLWHIFTPSASVVRRSEKFNYY